MKLKTYTNSFLLGLNLFLKYCWHYIGPKAKNYNKVFCKCNEIILNLNPDLF